MTTLLYLTDSYLREFEARVTGVDTEAGAIALDQTAFYPGGGGQPHDTGWLEVEGRRVPVTRVKRAGDDVWHYVEWPRDATWPEAGAAARGELDWDRRYLLMRTHTALHILCGVIWRDYQAAVTGGNMQPGRARMDFEFERMQAELVHEIEEKINREVEAARDIRVQILPREEALQIPDLIRTKINLLPPEITEVRTVEIVGLDLQADGGTHVANTREVGEIKIVDYKSKGRINKRLEIALA
ncbi:MAG: alanyl-tRNA editing protein AlaXM [Anaerolineae bacterium]